MHELTVVILLVGCVLAGAVVAYYLGLELRETLWSCPPDLPDAEGEALPAPYTTGRLHLVDLAGPDAGGIAVRGCWATVQRAGALVDCAQQPTDLRGVCRIHAEVLDAMREAEA